MIRDTFCPVKWSTHNAPERYKRIAVRLTDTDLSHGEIAWLFSTQRSTISKWKKLYRG